jgi:hypothetical protein
MKFKQYQQIFISHALYGHKERKILSTGEVVTIKSLGESKSFCTCPRAETRLTVYRSPLVRMLPQLVGFLLVERACIKLDVFFSSSGDVSDANVLVNLENSDSYHIEASIRASE